MAGTPEQQVQQLKEEYERRLAEIKQQAPETGESQVESEQIPVEHQAISETTEKVIQEQVPEFIASSHEPGHSVGELTPEAQEKVQAWVNIAFTKSLSDGIKAAKYSNDIALIDAFHSALTGSLYQMLVEQKRMEVVK
ncbi:MAG: hypothetical protein AAB374_02605 [Patescibacteria group bacterium]